MRIIYKEQIKIIFLILIAVTSTMLVTSHAWVTDDAYITFRYVNNTLSGYGPVFNVGERTQGFTHPLWFLLMLIGGGFSLDLFYYSIGISLALNFLMIIFLGLNLIKRKNYYFSILCFVIVLYSCSSFLDFQTSGLENSLTNFLLTMLLISLLKKEQRLIKTSIWSGLLIFNRIELILIVIPIIIYSIIKSKKSLKEKILTYFFGLTPIIIWELFSIIYYGFFLPNTFYAKVGAYTLTQGIQRGLEYLYDFIQWEPFILQFIVITLLLVSLKSRIKKTVLITIISILAYFIYTTLIQGDYLRMLLFIPSVIISLIIIRIVSNHFNIKNKKQLIIMLIFLSFASSIYALLILLKDLIKYNLGISYPIFFPFIMLLISIVLSAFSKINKKKFIALLIGSALHLFLIILIGGDYMRGRFLIPSIFLMVITITAIISRIRINKIIQLIIILIILIAGFNSYHNAESCGAILTLRIVNERMVFNNTLINRLNNITHEYTIHGLKLKNINQTITQSNIGMIGFFSGPNNTIIDNYGLTDAFIARTPPKPNQRPGHIYHYVAKEYYSERINNTIINNWKNDEMQELWHDIKIITQEDLFNLERINIIIKRNILTFNDLTN